MNLLLVRSHLDASEKRKEEEIRERREGREKKVKVCYKTQNRSGKVRVGVARR